MDCRLQSRATAEKRRLKMHSDYDLKYIVTDDSQFSGWSGEEMGTVGKKILKFCIYLSDTDIL